MKIILIIKNIEISLYVPNFHLKIQPNRSNLHIRLKFSQVFFLDRTKIE